MKKPIMVLCISLNWKEWEIVTMRKPNSKINQMIKRIVTEI